ncbi:hypothetical protein Q7P37_008775 [Cladosporium fusiforme]
MGLPIWRDPDEKKSNLKSLDPTAAARSSIRRRPSVHGTRRNRRLPWADNPPRLEHERSPPPVPLPTTLRNQRRNGVPPISTLLESVDRSVPLPPPPPPVPHSRHYYSLEQRERELRDSLEDLHAQAARLRRDAQDFIQTSSEQHDQPWTATERRTLLETARAAQLHRPALQLSRSVDASQAARVLSIFEARQPTEEPRDEPSESHTQEHTPRTVLPTPPLEQSEQDGDSLFVPDHERTSSRPLHPLSRSWRPESPIDGLGDRNQSPSPLPQDTWEIMEATIEPDATLPSAESSFSALPAANSSFASSNETAITEPERDTSSGSSRRRSTGDGDTNTPGDSASSVDAEDNPCTEEEDNEEAESFARDMFDHETEFGPGRRRIAIIQEQLRRSYSSERTPSEVEIGFRLIDEACETAGGRARLSMIIGEDGTHRMIRLRNPLRRQQQRRRRNPPTGITTSRDPPSAHPVSPPLGDISMLNDIDSDDENFQHTRRVVQRLAQREDVPDDWWMSMGITSLMPGNGRQRRRSPDGVRRADMAAQRVRSGRVERGGSRL